MAGQSRLLRIAAGLFAVFQPIRSAVALAWVLRDPRVTSALIGASSVRQLENSVGAVANLDFTDEELDTIDRHAVEGGINLWKGPSRA